MSDKKYTAEDARFMVGAFKILFQPETICLEGYRARWSPATWDSPGEWHYDSRYDPICQECNGEGCEEKEAREIEYEESLDALAETGP